MQEKQVSRRSFVSSLASGAFGFTIVPRHVLGGPGFTAPRDRINFAVVGAGAQGLSNARAAIGGDQQLVARHSVVMDPAYVHITRSSIAEHRRISERLARAGVYSIGRYGGWTYCSIEDNIVETRALARHLARG